MPLVLPALLHEGWLDAGADCKALLSVACARSLNLPLQVYPTDPRGNNVRFEGPEVVAPFTPQPQSAAQPAQQSLFAEPPSTKASPPRKPR
jgi:hypothetical protein